MLYTGHSVYTTREYRARIYDSTGSSAHICIAGAGGVVVFLPAPRLHASRGGGVTPASAEKCAATFSPSEALEMTKPVNSYLCGTISLWKTGTSLTRQTLTHEVAGVRDLWSIPC